MIYATGSCHFIIFAFAKQKLQNLQLQKQKMD